MTGTSNWKTIRERRVGNDPARVERAREAMVAELALAGLRKHRRQSQATVAKRLTVSQSSVSQLERSGDPKISTVADYVGALNGRLELVAVFDDERVPLNAAGDLIVRTPATRSGRTKAAGPTRRSGPKRAKGGVAKMAKGRAVKPKAKATRAKAARSPR